MDLDFIYLIFFRLKVLKYIKENTFMPFVCLASNLTDRSDKFMFYQSMHYVLLVEGERCGNLEVSLHGY